MTAYLLNIQLSYILDVLLAEPHYSAHWPRLQIIANSLAPWSSEALHTYILEALRLSPPITPFLRVSDAFPSISDWRYAQAIKKGDTLLLDIATASRDPTRFPDPEQIKLDHPQDSYLPFYDGPHSSLVMEIVMTGVVAQLRVLGRLQDLKEAPEMEGTLKKETARDIDNSLDEAHGERIPLPHSRSIDTHGNYN
jgi:cytochrome P450